MEAKILWNLPLPIMDNSFFGNEVFVSRKENVREMFFFDEKSIMPFNLI